MSLRDEMRTWDGTTVFGLVLLSLTMALSGVLVLGSKLWALLTGARVPWNPVATMVYLYRGDLQVTAGLVVCCVLVAVMAVALPLLPRWLIRGGLRGGKRMRGDAAASLTGARADTVALSTKAAKAKATRLGVKGDVVGLPIGRAVRTGQRLVSDLEAVALGVSGPRTGKTTCWVVPRILWAPGAVLATSNKRDIVDSTREQRGARGRVWVFDPQGIADTEQTWWWDIMSYVTSPVQARALAEVFVDATRDPNAQASAYFDSAARDLVAGLLLAAARSGRPLTELHRWLNNQSDDEPVNLLQDAGEHKMAATVKGINNLVPETRSGVYGSASAIMSFLLNEEALRWVTPSPWLEEFRPQRFVTSTDTLYCLSQEGRGDSAAPIVTALTVAVMEAAVDHAKGEPSGRLSLPMLVELDEAANVCKWRELPNMYSHFGSRGICVDTLLQSWSQGVQAWTEAGMKKLWSASNVKWYGGGVSERAFLSDLSELIGSFWVDSAQVSHSAQGRSSSTSFESQQRQIATVSDLQSLPAGRAWVLASGAKPLLAELVPYWKMKPNTSKGKEKDQ